MTVQELIDKLYSLQRNKVVYVRCHCHYDDVCRHEIDEVETETTGISIVQGDFINE